MNRILYLLSTNYVSKKNNGLSLQNNTLYDCVKVFTYSDSQKNYKIYQNNTAIYQNISTFELFNIKNWIDELSIMQNTSFNELLLLIDMDSNALNEYINIFNNFSTYIVSIN
jgi:hypothetical protein